MNYHKLFSSAIAILSITVVGGPATAHHSFAPYDMTRTLSAPAVIKDFHWGAPHSAASFVIKDAEGNGQTLTLQGAAPGMMARAGFNPRDMRRGVKVDITWHPLRSGARGGTLVTMKFQDGRVYKDTEYAFSDEGKQPVPPGASPAPKP
jgi:hypothetical protein